jgi:hypothetical protein
MSGQLGGWLTASGGHPVRLENRRKSYTSSIFWQQATRARRFGSRARGGYLAKSSVLKTPRLRHLDK